MEFRRVCVCVLRVCLFKAADPKRCAAADREKSVRRSGVFYEPLDGCVSKQQTRVCWSLIGLGEKKQKKNPTKNISALSFTKIKFFFPFYSIPFCTRIPLVLSQQPDG